MTPSFSFLLFLRCVLLPLLSVKPPQQSLFLLVDSIDEGCQLGEGEQRSSPGSPRTIAELLASHHEFLPPWLLLICSARRQNKAITKLFTGKYYFLGCFFVALPPMKYNDAQLRTSLSKRRGK